MRWDCILHTEGKPTREMRRTGDCTLRAMATKRKTTYGTDQVDKRQGQACMGIRATSQLVDNDDKKAITGNKTKLEIQFFFQKRGRNVSWNEEFRRFW